MRIVVFIKEKIKDILRKEYFYDVEKVISVFFKGDLVNEIMKIKENIIMMKNEYIIFKFE